MRVCRVVYVRKYELVEYECVNECRSNKRGNEECWKRSNEDTHKLDAFMAKVLSTCTTMTKPIYRAHGNEVSVHYLQQRVKPCAFVQAQHHQGAFG